MELSSPLSLCPLQLKKRALDQLRLVKPKHGGSPAGDPQEQLLLEPCSGECTGVCTGVKVQPGLPMEFRSVHLWVSFGLEAPVVRVPVGRGLRDRAPPGGRRANSLREPVGGVDACFCVCL